MFRYYLSLGVRSLRRNPVLTALMVITIGVGIAASVSTMGVLMVMSGNPIPHKSDRLIVPLLDNQALDTPSPEDYIPEQMTYLDATRLLEQGHALRQTAIYGLSPVVESGRDDLPPFFTDGLGLTRDFFAMFDVPFKYGGPWDAAADAGAADVVVISSALSERLFGEEDPVGRRLRSDDRDYTITGVIGDWAPHVRYYRLISGNAAYGDIEDVMIPFSTAVGQEFGNNGSTNCFEFTEPGYAAFLASECQWIQYWAELESAADREAYGDYLEAYMTEQKQLGRFERPPTHQLFDVMEWLDERGVVGNDSRLQTWLALGFLLVCLVNTVGLLLAKFTARAGEVGVRRALGAPRREIFRQFLVEAGVIGIAGGVAGLLLSFGGLWLISRQSESMSNLAHINIEMLASALLLALATSLIAGLLPTWRACQVRPAMQLKAQ